MANLDLKIREFRSRPPALPPAQLPPDGVHIWHWQPVSTPQEIPALWKVLAEDECQRAERFRSRDDRDEFVINHARLRFVLSGYMGTPPQRLVFDHSSRGKPSLRDGSDLRFNLSHTRGRAALAIALKREVGIDVEEIRSQCDGQRIAERFFSEYEQKSLQSLSPQEFDHAFFRCWTRKEAYIKARGEGLSMPLQQFDVSVARDEPAQLLSTRPDPEEAKRWLLYDLPLAAGYAAALVVAAASL